MSPAGVSFATMVDTFAIPIFLSLRVKVISECRKMARWVDEKVFFFEILRVRGRYRFANGLLRRSLQTGQAGRVGGVFFF